jgi:hypothetical protein
MGAMELIATTAAEAEASAAEARQATYDVALSATGIDLEADHFEGSPTHALMHFQGANAFDPEVFQPIERFLADIDHNGRSDGLRVPILSMVPEGLPHLDLYPYENSVPHTSLSIVEPGVLTMTSERRLVPEVGAANLVEERRLSLSATTASIPVIVGSRTARLNGEPEPTLSEQLTIATRQQPQSKVSFNDKRIGGRGISSILETASPTTSKPPVTVIGWKGIKDCFSRISLARATTRELGQAASEQSVDNEHYLSNAELIQCFDALATVLMSTHSEPIPAEQVSIAAIRQVLKDRSAAA